jgi:hypothetical protein
MTLLQILPILVYGATIVTIFAAAASSGDARPGLWRLPAVVGAAFFCFPHHGRAGGGDPVLGEPYDDLGRQSGLVRPSFCCRDQFRPDAAARARSVGMRPWPWAIAVVATACIALLPMLARLLWLEERQGQNR